MSDLYCIKPPAGLYQNNKDIKGWLSQPKLDGFRCLFISDGKHFRPISPNGKPLYNLLHIIEELESIPGALDYNIDGELFGQDWNQTAEIVRSSVTVKESAHIKLYCFDIIDRFEYESRNFKTPYSKRYSTYLKLFICKTYIVPIKSEICTTDKSAWDAAKQFNLQGYEGAVIKDPKGLYKCGRSQSIQRLKFTDTVDLVISSVHLGVGKNANRLGYVTCYLGNVKIKVGTGFSDEERENIWNNPQNFIGRCIEIKYQEKTKAGSLRFPTFVRFRDDKS